MFFLKLVALLLLSGTVHAQFLHGGRGGGLGGGRRGGRRRGGGGHGGGGHWGEEGHGGRGYGGGGPWDPITTTGTNSTTTGYPMDTIQKLMQNRQAITRDSPVNHTTGVSTFTKGNTDEVTGWIYQHVQEMKALRESGGRIRNWDGLFHEMFEHADLHLECQKEGGGVVCNNTGDTPCAIDLVQAHAHVVSLFLANGPEEVHKDHGEYVSSNC